MPLCSPSCHGRFAARARRGFLPARAGEIATTQCLPPVLTSGPGLYTRWLSSICMQCVIASHSLVVYISLALSRTMHLRLEFSRPATAFNGDRFWPSGSNSRHAPFRGQRQFPFRARPRARPPPDHIVVRMDGRLFGRPLSNAPPFDAMADDWEWSRRAVIRRRVVGMIRRSAAAALVDRERPSIKSTGS